MGRFAIAFDATNLLPRHPLAQYLILLADCLILLSVESVDLIIAKTLPDPLVLQKRLMGYRGANRSIPDRTGLYFELNSYTEWQDSPYGWDGRFEGLYMNATTALKTNSALAELINKLATSEGYSDSLLKSVFFMKSSKPLPRQPVIYDPSIVIIAQGQKRGYVGEHSFIYDANNYLVLSVPLPFECQTIASAEKPLLGMSVRVEASVIAELLLEMDDKSQGGGDVLQGFTATPLDETLLDAAERLLRALSSPSDARILGPQIVREITYRVLCGEQADALKALVTRRSKFAQIAKTLRRIHAEYATKLDVESLADEADMSVSAFHHNFKIVTSSAPLQYIKSVRLHKARMLMVHEGLNANTAAMRVGYESASQFSREFKRMFGSSPAEEATRLRQALS